MASSSHLVCSMSARKGERRRSCHLNGSSALCCAGNTILKKRHRQLSCSSDWVTPNRLLIASKMAQSIFSGLQSPFQKDVGLTEVLCHICQTHVNISEILGCRTQTLTLIYTQYTSIKYIRWLLKHK